MDASARPGNLSAADLRNAVRERYSAVAADPGASYSFRVGKEFAEALGYPPELLDALPESATAAFTGVATPMTFAKVHTGETVLDLGCGGGLDLALAARAVGPSGVALGIDMAAPMVARAAATVRSLHLGWASAAAAVAEALPVQDASMDGVVANGILNLSPDKSAVMQEVARTLKPGGRFVLAEITLRQELPPGSVAGLDDWFR